MSIRPQRVRWSRVFVPTQGGGVVPPPTGNLLYISGELITIAGMEVDMG